MNWLIDLTFFFPVVPPLFVLEFLDSLTHIFHPGHHAPASPRHSASRGVLDPRHPQAPGPRPQDELVVVVLILGTPVAWPPETKDQVQEAGRRGEEGGEGFSFHLISLSQIRDTRPVLT